MLAKTPLIDLAIAWAAEQPPERTYVWHNCLTCACAQLARAIGRSAEWEGRGGHPEWLRLNRIAQGDLLPDNSVDKNEHTLGGFHKRLLASV